VIARYYFHSVMGACQLLEVFTSLLGRVLISIHNLLVSVKCR